MNFFPKSFGLIGFIRLRFYSALRIDLLVLSNESGLRLDVHFNGWGLELFERNESIQKLSVCSVNLDTKHGYILGSIFVDFLAWTSELVIKPPRVINYSDIGVNN